MKNGHFRTARIIDKKSQLASKHNICCQMGSIMSALNVRR